MIFKIFLFFFLWVSISSAAIENVRVGSIDSYYANQLSSDELREVIAEIEHKLETQLGFDVFNYSSSGISIDIIYMAPLELEKKIEKNITVLTQRQEEIKKLELTLTSVPSRVKYFQENLTKFAEHINVMTNKLNIYRLTTNKVKTYTQKEYKIRQVQGDATEKRINRDIKSLNKERRILHRKINNYNRNIQKMNNLIKEYKRLRNETIQMNTNSSKVQESTIAMQERSFDTFNEDSIQIEQRSSKSSVSKIEIYGFENKNKLKAIIAHEIGHLVGVPHIFEENALMNPILQVNQIKNLSLTQEDIRNFKENF